MEFRGTTLPDAVLATDIPIWPKTSGKVRDIYDVGENLLIVSSDRISAYDSILASGIPQKGRVLTQLSIFWFDFLQSVTENHLITADISAMDERLIRYANEVTGRTMLVKKAEVIPVECIVRGYLAGSGWRSYEKTGQICGIKLPEGLRQSEKLPEPIFTPTTKATEGHDEDISMEAAENAVGADVAAEIRDKSLEIYTKAAEFAASKGVIIADTKFEFGICQGKVILIDEVLTPDSSRFWPADDYEPGRSQKSYDKQYVRDWLDESGWDHSPPAPGLPDEVVVNTLAKYVEAYERITDNEFTL